MKLKSLLVTALAASFILFGFTFAAPKLIVKIKSSSKLQEQKLNSLNLTRALPRSLFNKHKTDRTQSSRADSLLAELESYYIISGDQLANLPKDIAAEAFPNYIFHLDKLETPPNDPNYRDQWHLKALKAEQAWKIATGKDIAVAVVDAGIDFSAPDLINSLKVNSQEDINRNGKFEPWAFTETRGGVSGDLNGVDEDGNGFADDVVGYDFVNQDVLGVGDWADPDPIPEDEGGHGTPVSAVIAAQANNSIGVVGIAPDAKILACKAFDIEGAAESDDIAAAIIYAARSGAKVINCSFGEIYDSPIVRDAVRYAYERGCFIASSAGNNGWEYAHYPSDYSEVTSVAGINEDMTRWGLSNYGSMPDIAAPSTNILTIRADTAYARYQGTSFSAPCVSGAAALLLEIYPTLTPDEVRSTLMFSSDEAGKKGWDSLYGAGILDPYQALTRKPASVVAIESPQFYQVVSKDKAERLSVVGSVITPLFESYELLAGYGILPDSVWSVAATANNQVKNGELALIDLSNFDKDTVYTIVLKVNQKNGRDIQQRTHLWVTSNATSLQFNDFNVLPAFSDGKRVLLVAASSNRDAGLEIKWRKKGSQDAYASLYDAVNRSRAHIVSLADTLVPGVAYEAIATLRESDSLSVSRSFEFSLNDDYFPTSGFAQKPYRLPRAYFAPVVGDFYGEGKPAVAFSDLSNFGFGYPYLYQFENGDFKFRDSLNEIWIPMDFGETNGDGKKEFLGMLGGKTTLRQYNSPGGSMFSQKLMGQYENARDFWSNSLADLDGDGRDEIIVMKDTILSIYGNRNGEYKEITNYALPKRWRTRTLSRTAISGDFDGDGKIEIAHSNDLGNLFIYEFSNGALNLEFVDSINTSESSQFFAAPDVDGDGTPELLQGNVSAGGLSLGLAGADAIWNYRLLKPAGNNEYRVVWEERFTGVRVGPVPNTSGGYRNGAASGNVDGRPGDEVIISAFPNLYVFTFDNGTAKPLWRFPAALANTAVVYDFDGNGINELGFSGFNSSMFFEIEKSSAPGVPLNLRGWQTAERKAKLQWTPPDNAKSYNIYIIDRSGPQPKAVMVGSSDTVIFEYTASTAPFRGEFVVTAVNSSMTPPESDYSNTALVDLRGLARILFARAVDSMTVDAVYTQTLRPGVIEPTTFKVILDTLNANSIQSEVSTAMQVTPKTVQIRLKTPLRAFENNYLSAGSFIDEAGNPTIAEKVLIDYEPAVPAAEEMILTNLKQLSTSLFQLTFSHAPEPATVENLSNFTLEPIGEIIGAEVDFVDSTKVLITISNFLRTRGARGMYYEIVVGPNVRSRDGIPMTKGPGNRLGFVISAESIENVYLFPNPVSLRENFTATVGGLTPRAEVEILTIEGKLLRTLTENDANGGVEWDLKDSEGKALEPGVYLLRAKNTDEQYPQWQYSKFAIKR